MDLSIPNQGKDIAPTVSYVKRHGVNPPQQTWGGLASDFFKKILGAGYLFFLRGDLYVLGGPYPF